MTIEDIKKRIEQDPRNKEYTDRGIPPVFQVSEKARLLVIGQAPGKKVEESLVPFNDKSGEKLISWMGINREIFYSEKVAILPMDFYYPGKGKTGDLPPRKFIAQEYHDEILGMMEDIQMTILVGSYSMKYYLKGRMEKNLTETVKNYENYLPEFFPIVHPSPLNFRWQRNNPWFEEEVVPELQKRVKNALGME